MNVLLKCCLRREEDEPAGRPLTCQAGEQQQTGSVMNHGAADGLNDSVPNPRSYNILGNEGLAHCYHPLTQNRDNKWPNVPGTGVQHAGYQLGSFSAEGVRTGGRRSAWFCLLWPVFVSFVPGTLTQGR